MIFIGPLGELAPESLSRRGWGATSSDHNGVQCASDGGTGFETAR
jgi:hypothetical protein